MKRRDWEAMVASRTVGEREEVEVREEDAEMVEKREGGAGGYVVGVVGEVNAEEVAMEEIVAVEGDVRVGVGGGRPRSRSTRQETMTEGKKGR